MEFPNIVVNYTFASSTERITKARLPNGDFVLFAPPPAVPAKPETRCTLVPMPVARHNATCPRCAGPAYVGLNDLTCERDGGCKPVVEPEPDEVEYRGPYGDPTLSAKARPISAGERLWRAHGQGVEGAWHPLRDVAIAAWREKVRGG